METMDVAGKVALVTGANRGIGKAIVDSLMAHGAGKVYVAVRNIESAGPLVAAHGERAVPLALDLSNEAQIRAAAETATDAEIVINNAGVLKSASITSPGAFDALNFELDVNLFGLLRMAQAFGPVLKGNGGGAFVQLNSVVSMKCFPDFATYCVSKAAAYSATQALYWEMKAQGTAVLSVHPGPIATDMASQAGLEEIAEPPSQVAEAIVAGLKAGAFHVFTDTLSRQIGEAYAGFAAGVVEADFSEA